MSDLIVIDNGGGNVASVRFALQRLGVTPVLTTEPDAIRGARRVILPGVGTAGDAMRRLEAAGLDRLIPGLTQPVLGICLGMQLLFEASEEGTTRCLGILKGVARRIPDAPGRPVPHTGWNRLEPARPSALLEGIEPGAFAYFVHSYALPVGEHTIASTHYAGPFTAVASRGNFHGVQWHPERSASTGARLLANFLNLDA